MMDTKLFRQKILALAIQGKLLPQNPTDEPASALLQRIRAEKDALVKAGKRKADKHPSTITRREDGRYHETVNGKTTDITNQIPFEIPTSWEWVRFSQIAVSELGKTVDQNRNTGNPRPYLCSINVYRDGIVLNQVKETKFEINEQERYRLQSGDLLICEGGDVGRCSIWYGKQEMYYQNALHRVRFYGSSLPEYFKLVFEAYKSVGIIDEASKGMTIKHFTKTILDSLLIPLPPLAEQQRIVSRVEELFAHCDTIDQAGEDWERTASLARQKVLDLAIRGQLLPQNFTDEPASELLQRIRAEKDALVKAGKRKADKHPSTITRREDGRYHETVNGKTTDITDQIPFEIPTSWEWVRLGELCDYGVCQSRLPSEIPSHCWLLELEDIEKDTGRLLNRVFMAEREALSPKHAFQKGNVLYSKLRTYLNKVLIADMDGCCTSEILPLDFGKMVKAEYARLVLMSSMFLAYTATCGYGVKMPRLGTEDGRKALFPLPPLAEQQRIVDAVSSFLASLSPLSTDRT